MAMPLQFFISKAQFIALEKDSLIHSVFPMGKTSLFMNYIYLSLTLFNKILYNNKIIIYFNIK